MQRLVLECRLGEALAPAEVSLFDRILDCGAQPAEAIL